MYDMLELVDVEINAASVKALVIQRLIADGLLDQTQGESWSRSHALICRNASFLRKLFGRLQNSDTGDGLRFIIVKAKECEVP